MQSHEDPNDVLPWKGDRCPRAKQNASKVVVSRLGCATDPPRFSEVCLKKGFYRKYISLLTAVPTPYALISRVLRTGRSISFVTTMVAVGGKAAAGFLGVVYISLGDEGPCQKRELNKIK